MAIFDMIKLELYGRGVHNNYYYVQSLGGHYNFQYEFYSAFEFVIALLISYVLHYHNEALCAYSTCCCSSSLHLFEDSCLCRSLTVLAGSQYMYGSAFVSRVGPVIS